MKILKESDRNENSCLNYNDAKSLYELIADDRIQVSY